MEVITVRPKLYGFYSKILRSISNANPTGGIKPADNAAFGAQPQGCGKSTVRRIDRQDRPDSRRSPENAFTVAVS
jgi:hypothetical protein